MCPKIDFAQPTFAAFYLTLMFFTAYGGYWGPALTMLLCAWTDMYLTGERGKALPRRTFLY